MNIRSLFKKTYYPLNKIEISKVSLLHNYKYLSQLADGIRIAPVLKSNAYGHGLVQIAKILDEVNPPFICVDSIYEAYELLKHKVNTKILIMGYVNPENLKVKKLPFSYVVYERGLLEAISRYQPDAGIHIFVDTGMHREGIAISELPDFLKYININKNIKVEGLMSHFAESENCEKEDTQKQVVNFQMAQEIVFNAGFRPMWINMGNSSALLQLSEYKGKIGNLTRCGISIYGIDPEGRNNKLKPALQLYTTLVQVKVVPRGEKIGYSFTHKASKDMKIGILPIGYFDGVDRRLSNKGYVLIQNTLCKIVGKISMNLTTIDISEIKNPKIGESVIVYSGDPANKNSIFNAAQICNTIPYDLLVHLSPTTRRVVVS